MALRFAGFCLVLGLLYGAQGYAVIPAGKAIKQTTKLTEQLGGIRNRVFQVEKSLIDGLETRRQSETTVMKIRLLLDLQKQEKLLGRKRLAELETTVTELESRRDDLMKRILVQRSSLWHLLAGMHKSVQATPEESIGYRELEKIEAPRRKLISSMIGRGVREIETLKADLDDAHQLEGRIHEERQHLVYLFQDLNEQESILELNQKLQVSNLKAQHKEREEQLKYYQKLKESESGIEKLLSEFNARVELDKAIVNEKEVNRVIYQGIFAKLKGKLNLPAEGGKITTTFGRNFDAKSGLYVFRKGVDVQSKPKQEIRAVYSGRVAFTGELPNYGKVVIVDHGEHFYSLIGHLGALSRKTGDALVEGEILGLADANGSPIYFEIRARNVALNPKEWLK